MATPDLRDCCAVTKDQAAIKKFDALLRRLAPLEARERVTYNSLMAATRIHEKIAELRATASPAVRRAMRAKGFA
jgi:hypothetical protein